LLEFLVISIKNNTVISYMSALGAPNEGVN